MLMKRIVTSSSQFQWLSFFLFYVLITSPFFTFVEYVEDKLLPISQFLYATLSITQYQQQNPNCLNICVIGFGSLIQKFLSKFKIQITFWVVIYNYNFAQLPIQQNTQNEIPILMSIYQFMLVFYNQVTLGPQLIYSSSQNACISTRHHIKRNLNFKISSILNNKVYRKIYMN